MSNFIQKLKNVIKETSKEISNKQNNDNNANNTNLNNLNNVNTLPTIQNIITENPLTTSMPQLTSTTATPTVLPLSTFEQSLNNSYVGCFRDVPNKPKMKFNLGNVTNQLDCINKGKEAGVKYVALQNGNECYGSLNNEFMTDSVDKNFCNVLCSDQGTGNCGGTYFNQAYLVDGSKLNQIENFENVKNINIDNNKCKVYFIVIIVLLLLIINY